MPSSALLYNSVLNSRFILHPINNLFASSKNQIIPSDSVILQAKIKTSPNPRNIRVQLAKY